MRSMVPSVFSCIVVVLVSSFFATTSIRANSSLSVQGSMSSAVHTTTAGMTLDDTHRVVLVNATPGAGPLYINLPSPSTCVGRVYPIKKIDSGEKVPTISSALFGEEIDGLSIQYISYQYEFIEVISDGVHWWIIGDGRSIP